MDFHRVIKEDECGRAVEELEARLRKRSGKGRGGGGVYPSDAFPEQNALFLGPCVPRFSSIIRLSLTSFRRRA